MMGLVSSIGGISSTVLPLFLRLSIKNSSIRAFSSGSVKGRESYATGNNDKYREMLTWDDIFNRQWHPIKRILSI